MECLNAQSVKVLDEKYGFKDIRLDDPYSKWAEKTILLSSKGNEKSVKMKNLTNYSFAGFYSDRLILNFTNDYIVNITVSLAFQQADVKNGKYIIWSLDEFNRVASSLESLFGKTEIKMERELDVPYKEWIGDKIKLIFGYSHTGVGGKDNGIMMITKIKKIDF
jgi:hypothetical protein